MRPSQKNDRLVDLSWTVDDRTPIFPGDPAILVHSHSTVQKEGHAIKTWSSGMHVGTHLDAPAHFLATGGDVASIPLSRCAGTAIVCRADVQNGTIPTSQIRHQWNAVGRQATQLLIHTGWSEHRGEERYFREFPGFDREFASFVHESGIELLGVDMPSVRYADGDYAGFHRMLLSEDIVIVENLIHLDTLPETVWFQAYPLKLKGFDGSMVRALALVKASSDAGILDNSEHR